MNDNRLDNTTSRLILDRGMVTTEDWQILARIDPDEMSSYHLGSDLDYREMLKLRRLEEALGL